jgi:hypothetical protein
VTAEPKYRQHEQVVSASPEPGCAILLNLATGQYHRLNSTSSFMWEELRKPVTIHELASSTASKFQQPYERIEALVQRHIAELLERGLVRTDS